jgi:hypothetical protein
MKSFGIKRDEKDPRWSKYIEWLNERRSQFSKITGKSLYYPYYGIGRDGKVDYSSTPDSFDRTITLAEWEYELINPQSQFAGREYDEKLLREFKESAHLTVTSFLMRRYAKVDRVAEIKSEIEKLQKELEDLEK